MFPLKSILKQRVLVVLVYALFALTTFGLLGAISGCSSAPVAPERLYARGPTKDDLRVCGAARTACDEHMFLWLDKSSDDGKKVPEPHDGGAFACEYLKSCKQWARLNEIAGVE